MGNLFTDELIGLSSLGGAQSSIFTRFMRTAVAADRLAIEAIATALPKNSLLVATEDQPYNPDPEALDLMRAKTEDVMQEWGRRGARTSIIRLPPIVLGPDAFGLASLLLPLARKKKESAYVGNGFNRWRSVNHLDAANLFRLTLEHGQAGGVYHGVEPR